MSQLYLVTWRPCNRRKIDLSNRLKNDTKRRQSFGSINAMYNGSRREKGTQSFFIEQ
jgi:hypothetical protein